MATSYENQKSICIHKPRVTENFLQIANEDWMRVNKTLSPYGLQLYLYLASNNNEYQFALDEFAEQHGKEALMDAMYYAHEKRDEQLADQEAYFQQQLVDEELPYFIERFLAS